MDESRDTPDLAANRGDIQRAERSGRKPELKRTAYEQRIFNQIGLDRRDGVYLNIDEIQPDLYRFGIQVFSGGGNCIKDVQLTEAATPYAELYRQLYDAVTSLLNAGVPCVDVENLVLDVYDKVGVDKVVPTHYKLLDYRRDSDEEQFVFKDSRKGVDAVVVFTPGVFVELMTEADWYEQASQPDVAVEGEAEEE